MSAEVEHTQHAQSSRGRLRRLLANVSAFDISRALVRREVPLATPTTQLSMFGHGQGTRIQNSTVSTTVNYHYTWRDPLEGSRTDDTSQQARVQHETSAPHATVDVSPPPTSVELTNDNVQSTAVEQQVMRRDVREVYTDIMITQSRGFPLWIPSPNTFLPPAYRHSGVRIGDVGILTPEGAFDFLFNVFAEASDPIHANSGLTESFSPLRPPLRHYEIQRFKENTPGTLVADDSFERTYDAQDPSTMILTSSASEAAALVMPEDVYVVRMRNQERLQSHVSAHITGWYSHIKQTLGRDVGNGDLRVVSGYRKSTAFGIAAVSTAKNPTETRLTFGESEGWARQSGYKYRWTQVGPAVTKVGPEYRESAELMYPAYGTSTAIPENQCLFLSTIDVKLGMETWKSIESSAIPHSVVNVRPSSEWSPSSPLNVGQSTTASPAELSTSTKNPSTQILLSKTSLDPVIHPSNLLNDVLLTMNPEARMSTVCSDDWEDYMGCQDPVEFVSQIICRQGAAIKDGVIHIGSSSLLDGKVCNSWGNRDVLPPSDLRYNKKGSLEPPTKEVSVNDLSDSPIDDASRQPEIGSNTSNVSSPYMKREFLSRGPAVPSELSIEGKDATPDDASALAGIPSGEKVPLIPAHSSSKKRPWSVPRTSRPLRLKSVARAIEKFSTLLSGRRDLFRKPPRRKKALIIGINYTKVLGRAEKLSKSKADVAEAKRVLMEAFNFKESEITLLVDDEDGASEDLPTHDRILNALGTFVKKDENVDYVFIYAGYAFQSDEDGKSEYIMPLDSWSECDQPIMSKVIYDHELRSHLVDRLGKRSKLLAIINTCHSASLLNLKHYKCRRNERTTSFVRRLGHRVLCDPLRIWLVRHTANEPDKSSNGLTRLIRKFPYCNHFTESEDSLCTGFCHTEHKVSKYPRVVCISACKDSEMTVESNNGPSMLRSLLQLLETNQQPTFRQIIEQTRANVKEIRFDRVKQAATRVGEHAAAHDKYIQTALWHLCGVRNRLFRTCKLWNLQMSAEQPVDMNQKLLLA